MRSAQERLRDYFDLQLRFAEAVAATAALPLADAVGYYTNFYRRFGLGRWHDAPIAPEDHIHGTLADAGDARPTSGLHTSLLRAVSPGTPAAKATAVWLLGAIRPMRTAGYVFTSRTTMPTVLACLAGSRSSNARKSCTPCLRTCSIRIRRQKPSCRSWLYHLEAYRRLFPSVYGASRAHRPRRYPAFSRHVQLGPILITTNESNRHYGSNFLRISRSWIRSDCGRPSPCQPTARRPLFRRSALLSYYAVITS